MLVASIAKPQGWAGRACRAGKTGDVAPALAMQWTCQRAQPVRAIRWKPLRVYAELQVARLEVRKAECTRSRRAEPAS